MIGARVEYGVAVVMIETLVEVFVLDIVLLTDDLVVELTVADAEVEVEMAASTPTQYDSPAQKLV